MRAKGDSLLQLPQTDGVEFFVQFRLSDKQNLEQLLLRSLQIAQESDFLQDFRRKVVRFVDHKCSCQIPLTATDHVMRDLKQQFPLILAGRGKSQITGEVLQKLHGRESTVKYVGVRDVFALFEQLQHVVEQNSLAGPDLSSQDHKTLVASNAVIKGSQRFVVPGGGKQERGIWRDIEWIPLQAVEGLIHCRFANRAS